jgi:hypothetical protein
MRVLIVSGSVLLICAVWFFDQPRTLAQALKFWMQMAIWPSVVTPVSAQMSASSDEAKLPFCTAYFRPKTDVRLWAANICFRGKADMTGCRWPLLRSLQSGHGLLHCICLPVTQSGHHVRFTYFNDKILDLCRFLDIICAWSATPQLKLSRETSGPYEPRRELVIG